MGSVLQRLLLGAALGLMGCGPPSATGRTAEQAPIYRLPLRMSNAYLINTSTPVLVDAGTIGDMADLRAELTDLGLDASEIRLVIVTHAHHDHAGLASDLQRVYGAQIMLGAGDLPAAARGEDDPLKPTGPTGVFLKPFLCTLFPRFEPDVVVRAPVDLEPWGIAGKVLPMPGHTPGSLVVVLANHRAFVGDEMLGGALGGAFFPSSPGEHYYQADPAQNHRNIATLLGMGIETFYLGHGGPVAGSDVARFVAGR